VRKSLAAAVSGCTVLGLAVFGPADPAAHAAATGCTTPYTTPKTATAFTLTQPGGQFQTHPTTGGYIAQNDEWDSTAAYQVSSTGAPELKITKSSIANPVAGPPGAYASLYMGNHYGTCSPTAQDLFPMNIFTLFNGVIDSTSVSVTPANDTSASGVWDNSFDIWLAPSGTDNQNAGGGLEVMIWLSTSTATKPSPAGKEVQAGLNLGSDGIFNVYYNAPAAGSTADGTLTFERTTATYGISFGLDDFLSEALGYNGANENWSVIDVEFGYEIWNNGAGLAVKSFSLSQLDVG
jgi:hypothetical protein